VFLPELLELRLMKTGWRKYGKEEESTKFCRFGRSAIKRGRKVTARSLGRACPKWSRITQDFMESASSLFACIWGGLSASYWQNDDYRPSWHDVPAGSWYIYLQADIHSSPRLPWISPRFTSTNLHIAPKNYDANTVLRY